MSAELEFSDPEAIDAAIQRMAEAVEDAEAVRRFADEHAEPQD